MAKRLTAEEFIERAKAVHGDKYDYSNVEYVNITTKVCIHCHIHGEFWQIPDAHIRGQHCPKCMGKGVNTESFVKKAKDKHGNKYDYSKVSYQNNRTKVCIICPEHGEFWQTPATHLRGGGCPECAHKVQTKSMYGVETNDSTLSSKKVVIDKWRNMIRRCYSEDYLEQNPTYRECSVCSEWLTFSNFERWVAEQGIEDLKEYDLDKDLLSKGAKIYSPETCCFLPHSLNVLLASCNSKKDELPMGVYKRDSGTYRALVGFGDKKRFAPFSSIETAFSAYKDAKEAYVKQLAYENYSIGAITKRIYDALIQYEVINN